MPKPSIFIAMHYLELGGAEAALIGLLDAFDFDRVDVDLFLYSHRGDLMEFIPPEVNLLPQIKEYSMIEAPMTEALRRGCIRVVYGRMKSKIRFKRYISKKKPSDGNAIFGYVGKYVTPGLPKISRRHYDLAISFLTPHNVVLDKVSAGRKICWIHTDYTRIDTDTALELPVWNGYDNIVSISPTVTENFLRIFPSLHDRITEIENILPEKIIRKQAEAYKPVEISPTHFNILSIGRFTYPKNFDNIPDICRRIISITGIRNLRWHIIGFGGDEGLIRQRIREAGMEEHVIILGKKSNPYPYIKACDLYIQPSRYEGKSVTVREAQMLGKPVIIADYPTAKSQVENNIDGIIAPSDNAGCSQRISDVILHKEIMEQLSRNTALRDYSNRREIDKIYALL
ncbi:MAG: glycosyltransferase [Duncaniella sp.]|nr:glycosyltransferase [Duncaniella sp.]